MRFFFSCIFFLAVSSTLSAQDVSRAYNDAYNREIELLEANASDRAKEQEIENLLTDWNQYLIKDINSLEAKINADIPEEQREYLKNEKQQLELIYQENLARLRGEEPPKQTVVEEVVPQDTVVEEAIESIVEDTVVAEVPEVVEEVPEIIEEPTIEAEDEEVNGVVFKVQIAALSKEKSTVDLASQLGITEPIEMNQSNGLFKYTVGNFKSFKEAKTKADAMQIEGITPFVVAFKNGLRIPLSDVSLE